MTNIKFIFLFTFFLFTLTACGQTKSHRTILGKSNAEQELKSALSDKSKYNLINKKTSIIKDSLTAINVAESVLFSIYGEDNITKQRPYEVYLISKHWIICGTLPEDWKGGVFLIIIDARDSKIVKITHGQ
jgi:hypothetical protein